MTHLLETKTTMEYVSVLGIVLLIVVLVIGIILIARRSTKLRKLILKKRPKTAEVEAAAAISSKEATVKSSDGASKSIEGSRDI
ncbi:unnamed protein product [Haemonchus placei]|uniref:LPXTG cell wall anchor domain-containing protein n=1 Tax=Haemonchus placei TaxID=6290 RepID=A0A0N4X275_HAEPC|nr:unnamed protein product [Haemonchus placei]